ncbi:MAG: CocE/NonD family hydrolase, partial [Actinomycetota bacterium]
MSAARFVLVSFLLAISGWVMPAAADEEPPEPPADYTQIEGLSQAVHQIRRDVYRVPMDDGILMYLEVVRPTAEGRFPVILELSPYHGTAEDRSGTHILPWPEVGGEPLGLAGYFAPRGYAVAFADLRGTGRSQGCLDYIGPKDRADAYDIVEWLGTQPWSSGRVGMAGHSYDAMTQIMTAAAAPPHLETIVPSAGAPRMYDHEFQDGVPYLGTWSGAIAGYELIAWQRHLPPTPVEIPVFGITGDNFGNEMQYAGCGATQNAATTGSSYLTGVEVDWHRQRDHTAGFVAADIPVFHVQGAHDAATRTTTMPGFAARNNPEDKLWFGQWHHGSTDFPYPNDRFDQWTGALHAWFDRHLQLRDVDTGPPVELFLNDGRVLTADTWPLPESSPLVLYPSASQTLTTFPGGDASA